MPGPIAHDIPIIFPGHWLSVRLDHSPGGAAVLGRMELNLQTIPHKTLSSYPTGLNPKLPTDGTINDQLALLAYDELHIHLQIYYTHCRG